MPQKKILSVFIDESGDFGKYEPHSPNYYVTMVFHEQSESISDEHAYIAKLTQVISDELKKRSDYFNSFDLIVNYYDYGRVSAL